MSKPITMLSGLHTAELTLTKRGANNRRFAMTKGAPLMDAKTMQAVMATPAEGEDQFLATLKSQGLDEEKLSAALASYRMQKGMKDLIDGDTMAAVSKAAGYEAPAPAEAKPAPEPTKKTAPAVDLTQLDETLKTHFETVMKSNAAMAEKSAQMEAVIKSMQDDKQEKHYVAKAAKDYGHLPLANKELGLMLKSAHDVSPEFATGIETLFGRMDEVIKSNAMLTTMGAVAKANQEGGAWSKIEKLANGMVSKSLEGGNSLTKADAIDIVLKSPAGDALYREYLGDNPKQGG